MLTELCKYKDIFGVPNQGIHQHRLFGFAIMDIIPTIIVAWLISLIFKINFWISLITLFLFGEILHAVFCVETAFIKMIKSIIDL